MYESELRSRMQSLTNLLNDAARQIEEAEKAELSKPVSYTHLVIIRAVLHIPKGAAFAADRNLRFRYLLRLCLLYTSTICSQTIPFPHDSAFFMLFSSSFTIMHWEMRTPLCLSNITPPYLMSVKEKAISQLPAFEMAFS